MFKPKNKKEKRIKLSKDSLQKAKRIFSYMRPYRSQFLVGWIILFISSAIGLLFPLILGQLLGGETGEDSSLTGILSLLSFDTANSFALGLFIIFGFQAILSFFRVVLFTNVTESTLRDIRKDAFQRLVYMPMDFFNKNKVGELTSRISSDITQIQTTLQTTIAEFFRQIVIIVGGITFLAFISMKLALIMLGTLPVIIVIAVIFGKFIKRFSKEAQDEAANSNVILEEALMGISNVKSFTNETFMLTKFKKVIDSIRALNIKSGLWRGVFISFIIFTMFGAIVFVIWQGLLMTQGADPELARGDFFSFIMFTVMMGASFGALPDMYANIQKAVGATENLMTIIETESELELNNGKLTPEITGVVAFESVNFSYPQRKDIEVLKNISFDIKENQTIALVGASGSGKSTIASLLLNYYPLASGQIKYNGVSASEIDTYHLRSSIAIVPQEVILFAGSIRENILFGDVNATNEAVHSAAKQANALEFIETFPEGMETQVGDRGIQLSGGQKQRIAIARAILKNPKILILDEATSALDSESEKAVQEALNKLMVGRTSFVIAHRLSTIKNANNIFVIENGEIIEKGNHDELIQLNGKYSNLVNLQGFQ
ncbi:ABC transporter ATP-binding protein/permease [Crocinitomicaceae bacterium]|nr:ABC transporter ATP-binding protein/permease [Crocinitomicaceae bacterium]MDB4324525.1 ABC transporter ATP-binding protein/permease [Crocinitomicaceae bacterium]